MLTHNRMEKRKSFVFARQYRIRFSQRTNALLRRNRPIMMAIGMAMHDFHSKRTKTFYCTVDFPRFCLMVGEITQFYFLYKHHGTSSRTYFKTSGIRECIFAKFRVENTLTFATSSILKSIEIGSLTLYKLLIVMVIGSRRHM